MEPQLSKVLARTPFLGTMPEADRVRLLGYARPVSFTAGERLFDEGDPAHVFFLIVAGTVELSVAVAGRRAGVVGVLGCGETAGELAVLDGGPYPASARALDAVGTLAVPAEPFLRHIEGRTDLLRGVLAGASGTLRALLRENGELKAMPTADRLCGFLLRLVEQPAGSARIRLPFEKRVLAGTLGVSPESLSRAFGRLRRLGVSTGRSDVVVIRDVAQLRRLMFDGGLDVGLEGGVVAGGLDAA